MYRRFFILVACLAALTVAAVTPATAATVATVATVATTHQSTTSVATSLPRAVPAIDQRNCSDHNSILFVLAGGQSMCFGGYVGNMNTNFWAWAFETGIYYGDVSVNSSSGCYFLMFKPHQYINIPGAPGNVINVAITPPF